jgi:hypothetical protein
MKKILTAIVLLYNIILSAQNPILNIHTADFAQIENAYYKDIEQFQNKFVGTWVYTDAVKTIRFRFAKKQMFFYQSFKNCYVDFLVGEMQYIENGVEKINSLTNLNVNHPNIFNYSMNGDIKVHNNWYPKCDECDDFVPRLPMSYDEPNNDDVGLRAAFVMRRADEGGVQKIKIQYIKTNTALGVQSDYETPSTTTNFTIPYGDYTLIKEN